MLFSKRRCAEAQDSAGSDAAHATCHADPELTILTSAYEADRSDLSALGLQTMTIALAMSAYLASTVALKSTDPLLMLALPLPGFGLLSFQNLMNHTFQIRVRSCLRLESRLSVPSPFITEHRNQLLVRAGEASMKHGIAILLQQVIVFGLQGVALFAYTAWYLRKAWLLNPCLSVAATILYTVLIVINIAMMRSTRALMLNNRKHIDD